MKLVNWVQMVVAMVCIHHWEGKNSILSVKCK